jgi:CheY-like chemotaxis protein
MSTSMPDEDHDGTAAPQDGPDLEAEPAGATVLVAEDDALQRMAIAEHLRGLRFKVIEASSGLEALRLVAHYKRTIDVVFCDIRLMPGMSEGVSIALWIDRYLPGLPVVLTSGAVQAPDGRREGEDFFAKPVNFDAVAARLAELARGRDPGDRMQVSTPPPQAE